MIVLTDDIKVRSHNPGRKKKKKGAFRHTAAWREEELKAEK